MTRSFSRDAKAFQTLVDALATWPRGWNAYVKRCCEDYFQDKPASPALVLHQELISAAFGFVNYRSARNAYGVIPTFLSERTKECLKDWDVSIGDRKFYASHGSNRTIRDVPETPFEFFPNLRLTNLERESVSLSPRAAAAALGASEHDLPFLSSALTLDPNAWLPLDVLNAAQRRIYQSGSLISVHESTEGYQCATSVRTFQPERWKTVLPKLLRGELSTLIVKRAFPLSFEDVYVAQKDISAQRREDEPCCS